MREVILSEKAADYLEKLFIYLEKEWPKKVKSDIIKKLEMVIQTIQNNPDAFPYSLSKEKLHCALITKHNKMFYYHNKKRIEIVMFIDSRMNL